MFCQNNKSASDHSDFVVEAIENLLVNELIEECDVPPYVVNPLTVSVQFSGKKRLILDLRHVNVHLCKQAVKYEDMKTLLTYLKKDSFMFSFDLHSAYHHVDIFYPHTTFLGFSWKINGKIRYFKFLVLPFEIRSAPFLFTKLTRPLVKK